MKLNASRRSRFLTGLLVAASLLGAVEVAAHALLGPPPPSMHVARVGMVHVTATGLAFEAGMTDPGPPVPPKSARLRVVFLGGSTVRNPFDHTVGVDFPTPLQRLLPEAELLNLGVPGIDTAAVWSITRELSVLQPDLVVVHTGHNDYNAALFQGKIRSVQLWRLPIDKLLSNSWFRAWLQPVRVLRQQGPQAARVAVTDPYVLRVRPEIDARFREELTMVVRASPAPVVLTTLFRSFGHAPNGDDITSHPDCPTVLRSLPVGPDFHPSVISRARAACGDSATTWYLRAQVATDPIEKAHAWDQALALDVAPLRAPLVADRIIREVAAETGATLADIATTQGGYQPGSWFSDPLHTNAAGAEAMAEALAPALREAVAKLPPPPTP